MLEERPVELAESVYTKLGVRAPRGDALSLLAADRVASEGERSALRRAVISLISDLANESRDFSEDARADLFTIASYVFGPGRELDVEDRVVLVGSLCNLASSHVEDIARRSRGVLLAMREPGRVDFWLNLDTNAEIRPTTAAVFQGISDVNVDRAFHFLADLLSDGYPVGGILEALVQSLPREDTSVRLTVQECFADFIASVPDEFQATLSDAPTIRGSRLARCSDRAAAGPAISRLDLGLANSGCKPCSDRGSDRPSRGCAARDPRVSSARIPAVRL